MPLDPSIWNPSLQGPPGADGKTIHTVSGAPSDSLGEDYDYALDPVMWVIYGPKLSGSWPAGTSLVGPAGQDGAAGVKGDRGAKGDRGETGTAGTDGSTIHAGLIAPDLTVGNVGDYYVNLETLQFYGPKILESWGVPVTLRGADGADGLDGTDGADGADAVPIPLAYGQLTISQNSSALVLTAADPVDLSDNTDYIQVAGIWDAVPHGLQSDFTQGTNSLVCNKAGTYMIHLWATATSNINFTNFAFKFAINGVISLVRRPWRIIRNAGEYHSVAAFGFIELEADDVVTLWVAADKSCDFTIADCVFALHELEAQGRHAMWQEEGTPVLDNPSVINFVGDGVTVAEDPAGELKITIPGGTNNTGIVETVVAGTGISVDSTDPANPIVSATGGGGGTDSDSQTLIWQGI